MKPIVILLAVAALFVGATVCLADSPHMGTWKLNEAKSKLNPGSPKNNTVIYEAAGDDVKVTVDGVDGQGNPSHNEWTGKFNGKSYAVTGDPNLRHAVLPEGEQPAHAFEQATDWHKARPR